MFASAHLRDVVTRPGGLALSTTTSEGSNPSYVSVLRAGAVPRTISSAIMQEPAAAAVGDSPAAHDVLVLGPTPPATPITTTTYRAAVTAPTPEPLSPYRVYVVQQGDTASSVASRFDLKTQSIIWSNPDIGSGDSLAIGQKLMVPAADGVVHEVRYGETLSDIAAIYGVSVDAIISFSGNHLASADDIRETQTLFIPGGQPPAAVPTPQPTPPPPTATATTEPANTSVPADDGSSSGSQQTSLPPSGGSAHGLIWPVVGPISSYYGPSHPLGIDIDMYANPTAPVAAATSGTVIFAGGNPCCSYGYYVEIMSPTGIETLYGHLSQIDVTVGETVAQGQIIGNIGCTGYCTGPHLHFEVIDNGVREDPLAYLP